MQLETGEYQLNYGTFRMCSLASKSDCHTKKNNNNNQPLLVSNFASCVAILEIPFKKNQAERNKHFANRSWLLQKNCLKVMLNICQ